MTVKELYEWALKEGYENAVIGVFATDFLNRYFITEGDICYLPNDKTEIYLQTDL